MKIPEYIETWKTINKQFIKWYDKRGTDWDDQKNYLKRKMRKTFSLDKMDVDFIFDELDRLFPEDADMKFDWADFQLPTLMVITAKYIQ
jgi:hypothetical protein